MRKQTILIVDDNEVNLFLAEKMRANKNINFINALNGQSALEKIKKNNIDLILLDVAMPEMSGFEVCEILKNNEDTKEIPIFFLTSRTENKDIIRGFKLGAADYIKKPFIKDELLLRVKKQLELKLSKDKLKEELENSRQKEKQLSEGQNRLKIITDNAKDAIIQVDDKGKVVFWNNAATKIFSYQRKEILGKNIHNLLVPLDLRNIAYEKFKEFAKTGKGNVINKTVELVAVDKFSNNIPIEISISVIKLNDKWTAIGIVKNITKRKNDEAILLKSIRKYKNIIKNLNDIYYRVDANGIVTMASPSALKILGYSNLQELIGISLKNLYKYPKERVEFVKLIKKKHQVNSFKTTLFKKDRTEIIIEISATALFDINKKFIGVEGIARDITKQIENENQLQQNKQNLEKTVEERTKELTISRNKFKNIFDTSNDAIFITDTEGNFIELNSIAKKRIKLSKNNKKIINLKEFHSLENSKSLSDYFKLVIRKGENVTTSFYKTKKENTIHIELNGKLIKHNNKKAILHISRDITERKELEEKKLNLIIKTEEKERSRFAKDLHDGIGVTLSAAKMYLNIAKRVKTDSEKKSEMIEQALLLMNDIGKDVKQIAVNIKPHNLQELGLITALNNFCEKLNSIGAIKIEFNTNIETIKLDADVEINIFRTINELINNTLKYAEAKNIFINLLDKKEKIIINYEDNGKGFDFEKIKNSNKTGTGLHNIMHRAKLLNGKVNISSKKGKGIKAEIIVKK